MFCFSHLLKNFPSFVVIHIIKGLNIVNETEVDAFLLSKYNIYFHIIGNFISLFTYLIIQTTSL